MHATLCFSAGCIGPRECMQRAQPAPARQPAAQRTARSESTVWALRDPPPRVVHTVAFRVLTVHVCPVACCLLCVCAAVAPAVPEPGVSCDLRATHVTPQLSSSRGGHCHPVSDASHAQANTAVTGRLQRRAVTRHSACSIGTRCNRTTPRSDCWPRPQGRTGLGAAVRAGSSLCCCGR